MVKKHSSSGLSLIAASFLIGVLFFFSGCKKEEFIEPSVTSEIPNSSLRTSAALPEVFGMYTTPTNLIIGNSTSENKFLNYLRSKGGNMVNAYARNSMNTSSSRAKFAAFCRKAVNSYGMKLITCDIRETSEIAWWEALYTSYPDLRTIVAPLTEKEPWVTGDYTGCFKLLRQTKAMCNRYGAKFYFYEGWMGKNYSNPQAAVDSMVYYCDGIFLTNYVSASDYFSTSAGLGKWDNRIKYRLDQGTSKYGGITKAAKKFNKLNYPIIELQSLEPSMLLTVYAVTGRNREFYGLMYREAKALYNQSSADVLKYTELKGKTIFFLKYALQAQPY
jgi:hypothetical protein